MINNMVKEYSQAGYHQCQFGIQGIENAKRWSVIHIRFLSYEKIFQSKTDETDEDETSFDIENISSEQGLNDLDECFFEFCKEQEQEYENNTPAIITDIRVYASADTKEELEALTTIEN